MKTPFRESPDVLIDHLESRYGIRIQSMDFIPAGDSAYSYRLDCTDGLRYYLKIMDRQNDRQRRSRERLGIILPFVSRMYLDGRFRNTAAPVPNRKNGLITDFHDFSAVLFDFIQGGTLADAYPLSVTDVRRIAGLMADLHQLTPEIDQTMLPAETFDLSFESELEACLTALHTVSFARPIVVQLQNHVLPRKTQIIDLLILIRKLREVAIRNPKEQVLCHGDFWGGNLIRHENDLYLIDWESAMLAPREYDLAGYLGVDFPGFISAYEAHAGRPVILDPALLRFYAYRRHLRNLTNWCMNILYRNTDDAQNQNDLDMILHHCIDRWGSIESDIANVKRYMKNEKRAPVRPLHPQAFQNP